MNETDQPIDPCEALTVREVAALLHVSRPTVEKHIKNGELPSFVMGRCRRIRRMDLEAFLESRTAYGMHRQPEPPPFLDSPMEWSDGEDLAF